VNLKEEKMDTDQPEDKRIEVCNRCGKEIEMLSKDEMTKLWGESAEYIMALPAVCNACLGNKA